MRAPGIDDYAVIGDCRSAALVARSGSLDWLCWPRFESGSLFAALLDRERGGAWRIAPCGPARVQRRYLDETNVLQTRFELDGGAVVLTDLMTIPADEERGRRELRPDHEILRRVECVRGEVEIEMSCAPRPDFARSRPRVRDAGAFGVRCEVGRHLLTLRSQAKLSIHDDEIHARLRLHAGHSVDFSLTFDAEGPAVLPPLGDAARERIELAVRWWRQWARRARYEGPYRDEVVRSALALKLLCFAPSGAIVAAPSTSLPERMGGDLNWDYRFCWLRDAAFTTRALYGLGYADEAVAFCSWLLHATRLTRPKLGVLYDVYGRVPGPERELPHLAGHHGSRPVRIGNATARQKQLDIYGEVIDAVAHLLRRTGDADRDTRHMLRHFGEYVCRHWHEPDAGIWEPRGEMKPQTFSRVMCWTALDRLLDLQTRGIVPEIPVEKLREHRERIRRDVEAHAYSERLGAYTRTLGGDTLDATMLLMPWYGFEDAGTPRMRSTYRAIEDRLGAGRGLLYRYDESLEGREGAFSICSFWAVEFLARGGGTPEQATAIFEAMRGHANDVGLFAEEIDPRTGAQLGNMPQGYTHVGLINAARTLADLEARAPSPAPPQARLSEEAIR